MSLDTALESGGPLAKLSEQEKQALLLLSADGSDAEIARPLFLGEGTVRNYVNSIHSKLGLNDRAEAVDDSLKHNLRGHMGNGDQV